MIKFIILLLSIFVVSGCGYIEGTVQKAERSFLVFTGNLENVKVHIDDMEPFTPTTGKQYQVSPGKHKLMAYKDGNLLVNRVVILTNQVITEINIP